MKAFVEHCSEQTRTRLDTKENKQQQWYPNDVELVQAVVAANRYEFQSANNEENQFQRDIKKQKINNDSKQQNFFPLENAKTIHTKKWSTNITINPIGSLSDHNPDNNNIQKNRNNFSCHPIEKTFLYI